MPTPEQTIIRKTCIHCFGVSEIKVDTEKYNRWRAGEFVQDVWPEKSASEREVMMTGTHSDCFDQMFHTSDPD